MQRIRGVSGPIVGHYRVAAISGLTAGLAAGAAIFSARWATTSNLRAAITHLKATAQIVTPFTAQQELQTWSFLASSFTVSDSTGASVTPPAGQNSFVQVSEAAQASQFTDMRICGAAALTAGTRTVDNTPFAAGIGAQLLVAASAQQNAIVLDFDMNSDQRTPIILQGGGPTSHGSAINVPTNAQGIIVANGILQGAGGTVRYVVEMEWLEYNSDSAEVIN